MQTIVITGGPCAGKTTALAFLRLELNKCGYVPIVVPECATALISSGIAPWTASLMGFQRAVFELQLAQEEVYSRAARALENDRVVVVLDRGLLDGYGYITADEFDLLLAEHAISHADALGRYGAVFHLQSTAAGEEEAYTRANNDSRFEDVREAVEVERKILDAWEAHPRRHFIGNEDRFEDKCVHLLNEVLGYLGGA